MPTRCQTNICLFINIAVKRSNACLSGHPVDLSNSTSKIVLNTLELMNFRVWNIVVQSITVVESLKVSKVQIKVFWMQQNL